MAKINQTITAFPQAPNSATDTPQQFNVKANAFVGHQSGVYVGEVNNWATEANALRDDINSIVATIPEGLIDDTTPSYINTFSSNKQNESFAVSNGTDGQSNYTKMADGTLICSSNSIYATSADGDNLLTFPYPFINPPSVTTGVITSTSDSIVIAKVKEVTETQMKAGVLTNPGGTSTNVWVSSTYSYIAIGRWK